MDTLQRVHNHFCYEAEIIKDCYLSPGLIICTKYCQLAYPKFFKDDDTPPRASVSGFFLTIGFCRRSVRVVKWPYSSPKEKRAAAAAVRLVVRGCQEKDGRGGGHVDFVTSLCGNFS